MAKLSYVDLIEKDQRAKCLANLGLRLNELDTTKLMPRLINLVLTEHLEFLAESHRILGVYGYWLAESDQAKRQLIKNAYELHRRKGTPYSLREIVRRLGFGEITIIEGLNHRVRDGSTKRDGLYVHGHNSYWAHYRILLNNPITNNQAALLRKTLTAFAPARCVLASLDYTSVPLQHNGQQAVRDGTFNKGTA